MSTPGPQGYAVDFPTGGEFEQALTTFVRDRPMGAARLSRQIKRFANDPDTYGRFLRGAMDGRKRYLIPASGGHGLLDELVAVAEVNPETDKVTLLRMHEVKTTMEATKLENGETHQAEQDYII